MLPSPASGWRPGLALASARGVDGAARPVPPGTRSADHAAGWDEKRGFRVGKQRNVELSVAGLDEIGLSARAPWRPRSDLRDKGHRHAAAQSRRPAEGLSHHGDDTRL